MAFKNPRPYWGEQPPPDQENATEDDVLLDKYVHILQQPLYSPRGTLNIIEDLTYRKINDWDTNNLIKGSREKKEGWRKFSFVDLIKLRIISELKRFGLGADKIRKFLEQIFFEENSEFSNLETYICRCLDGNKFLVVIDDIENIFFVNESELPKNFFPMEQNCSPLLILPLFWYVQDIAVKDLKINPSTAISKSFADEKEKRILEIIRNKQYEEITIVRTDGEKLLLKAKSRQRGAFTDQELLSAIKSKDYQQLVVAVRDGKMISINQDEVIKI